MKLPGLNLDKYIEWITNLFVQPKIDTFNSYINNC